MTPGCAKNAITRASTSGRGKRDRVHQLEQPRVSGARWSRPLRDGVEHVMRSRSHASGDGRRRQCLRDESLPVNGAHYTEFMGVDFRDFPDAAYTREHFYNTLQRDAWRMVPNRPIMKGEIYFANGYSTDRFATIGGDRCFIGVGQTMEARGLWAQDALEGYRWAEVSSWHFWMTNSDRQYYNSWSPVAVLCRQWNWTFGAGNDDRANAQGVQQHAPRRSDRRPLGRRGRRPASCSRYPDTAVSTYRRAKPRSRPCGSRRPRLRREPLGSFIL
jgi:hypothetical protein